MSTQSPPVLTRTLCAALPGTPPGSEVLLRGWVHRRRELASVAFLVVRDRSGLAQVVVHEDRERLAALPEETTVEVRGTLVENTSAPGGVEVVEPRLTPLTEPAATPPVELWRPSLDAGLATVLDHAAVTWRHPARRRGWDVAAASLRGFRSALALLGFTEVCTPKLVGGATETGATVFEVDYFGRTAYLAQSPQLHKQQLVGVFERVYEVGPVFRAEPHDTARHLAQYTSLDVELGFIEDHHDVLAVLREALAGMVAAVAEAVPDLALPEVPAEVPVVGFAEALEIAGAPADEPDLSPAHERAVGAWALAEHGSDLVAVEGYPLAARPFYTHPWTGPERPGAPGTNGFDVLFRGVELVTGGQRLHTPSAYAAAMAERGIDPAPYADHLAVFDHGMPPHGGFAIGLERWVSRLVGATNVREVTLFPRDLHRLSP
ncbi:aspartate--tRNA(Asn) ligase [Nocardioides sp. CFH 31398]|uniref:aspartate--tRNA(Asn) ligase n=1 Tax=Nocardioides sp. CFH 31398 TaxID=2919579 RepID=UPI001F05A493|nr:aspartate--tRNA(Asn) ligase [Nocardioides sp. CFH 31398]MCH1868049.1 aspartate--tRNA(Asn) ligase [Nocardioides sp. CFH 31398]